MQWLFQYGTVQYNINYNTDACANRPSITAYAAFSILCLMLACSNFVSILILVLSSLSLVTRDCDCSVLIELNCVVNK